jgi:hypothetical protein
LDSIAAINSLPTEKSAAGFQSEIDALPLLPLRIIEDVRNSGPILGKAMPNPQGARLLRPSSEAIFHPKAKRDAQSESRAVALVLPHTLDFLHGDQAFTQRKRMFVKLTTNGPSSGESMFPTTIPKVIIQSAFGSLRAMVLGELPQRSARANRRSPRFPATRSARLRKTSFQRSYNCLSTSRIRASLQM